MDESIYALNAECDAMQDEIARLEAENAELLEQLKYERQTSRSRLESIDLLKVENDKLRELTRHLFWWDSDSRYAKGCQECPTKTDCNGETCIFWDVLRDRARELGIEVD